MLDIEKSTFKGFVKKFNGQYGFLTSEQGDTYFHKSGILGNRNIEKGDEIEFKVELSNKKKGSFQAFDIVFLKRVDAPLIILENPISGILKWFNIKKGYGIIETFENIEYFLHKSNIFFEKSSPIAGDFVIFEEKIEKGKKSAIHCKVADKSQQRSILDKYLKKNGNIDDKTKYERVKYFWENSKIDKEIEEEFRIAVYNQCDIERKFNMWVEGLTQEKNLNNIAQQITQISINSHSYLNPFVKLFEKLSASSEQETVLKQFLANICSIDNEEKYSRAISLASCPTIDKKVKEIFLISVYNHCDIERKFNMWVEGLTQEKNLNNIAQQITQISINSHSYLNPFAKLFEKLSASSEQETVLKQFLANICSIDNEEKYSRAISLASCPTIEKKVKEVFLSSVYNHCDNERKFNMWLEGLTKEINLHNIAQQIKQISINSYSNPFAKIFEKLVETSDQKIVLKQFLANNCSIDNEEKYNRIKHLVSCPNIAEKVKEEFLFSVFNNCDAERKFNLWIDGYSQEKDLEFIAQKITFESIDLYQIFEKLLDTNSQENILIAFFKLNGNADSKEKYSKIKSLQQCSALYDKVKVKFQLQKLIESNIHYQVERFLSSWQFNEIDIKHQLTKLFSGLDINSFYSFCIELINPLAKINTHYKYKGYSHLKIYLENRQYIEETNIKYGSDSIFCFNGTLLNDKHFETKITYFKIISTYIENHYSILEGNAKAIIDSDDYKIISNFLKTFKAYYSSHDRICTDLLIGSIEIFKIEDYIKQKCNTSLLIKLWVHSIIDYFNFNNYCFYYFTLTQEERKIFNKKAKAKMGEEIKSLMLKKREPWNFVKKELTPENIEAGHYTATWKSIWFGNGYIKICMNNSPLFSQNYLWEFSEEKFNFLYEYISGRKLRDLKITATNDFIINIEGLNDLEELIWKILIIHEIEEKDVIIKRSDGVNRIPINMILRNQCIQLLNTFQLKELQPTRVIEKTFNIVKGGIAVDVSLLYSIPVNDLEVVIIWESLELEKAKATHIFKCTKLEYGNIFSEIAHYLSGNLKVRSTLNSKDEKSVLQQRKLRYLSRIEHDNFNYNKWENSLYEILPELKVKNGNIEE